MSLDERILALQHSGEDPSVILAEYMPFIIATASRATGRRIGTGDDELSIALSAFHEAIASYDGSRGSFQHFAAEVIRRRLIDHIRRVSRHGNELPFSTLSTNQDGDYVPYEIEDDSQQLSRVLLQEIDALSGALAAYGISFDDLAAASPRSAKTRRACAAVVQALLSDVPSVEQMRVSGKLPVGPLSITCTLPRKILERHRKYIIAAVEILTNDYPCLSDYVSYLTGGKDK